MDKEKKCPGGKAPIIDGTNITLQSLNTKFTLAQSEYSWAHRRAQRLDALDRNKLWDSVKAKFPTYQLLPQTNHVSYIKNNILASIYTVGKSAQLLCTSEQDKDIVENLNIALEHIWDTRDVAFYQLQAGERAALLNLGITQVGWDNNIVSGKDVNFEKGQVVLKNVDPLKYYRDPYADCLDNASFVVTWEDYHSSVIAANPNYKDEFKRYKHNKEVAQTNAATVENNTDRISSPVNKKGYHRIYTWFVRDEDKIHEIHVIDMEHVLYKKENIKPSMFPFAELYCNLPAGDLLGTSEPANIMDDSIVYNIMKSITCTSEYKNQRPPRFVSGTSGINVNAFIKHGNDADHTFVVQGDASKAVHYHEFPQPTPAAMQNMSLINQDIMMVTGVDGKYTGRDTGSAITTGGINSILDQATMIDTTKIQLYENYAKRLSQLIIYNYIENSAIKRTYIVKDPKAIGKYKTVVVPFDEIDPSIVFDYTIDISSEMPKNKARIAATADAMMEKQMQYNGAGIEVDLITPQEWLMMQDIPHKEYFEERMGIQRSQNWTSIVAQAVTQYAALVDNGMNSADAIRATADTMSQQQTAGKTPDMNQIAQDVGMFQ